MLKKQEENREERRKSALARFSVGDSIDIGNALANLVNAATEQGSGTPEESLTALMIAAKSSGMEVDTLFEYFDKNNVRSAPAD